MPSIRSRTGRAAIAVVAVATTVTLAACGSSTTAQPSDDLKAAYVKAEAQITTVEDTLVKDIKALPSGSLSAADREAWTTRQASLAKEFDAYEATLQTIYDSLEDGPCRDALTAYQELESNERLVLLKAPEAIVAGDPSAAVQAHVDDYTDLAAAPGSAKVDEEFGTACGVEVA